MWILGLKGIMKAVIECFECTEERLFYWWRFHDTEGCFVLYWQQNVQCNKKGLLLWVWRELY